MDYGGSGVVPFSPRVQRYNGTPLFHHSFNNKTHQICAGFWWPCLPLCACCNVQTAENHSQFNNKNLSNMCRILVAISASLCLPLVSKLRKIILHRISSINSYLYNYGPQRILWKCMKTIKEVSRLWKPGLQRILRKFMETVKEMSSLLQTQYWTSNGT